jgi:diacylglycerol O-acyltransferase-1
MGAGRSWMLCPAFPQDWLRMIERLLKLSLPTLYWWLAMFYTLFDLWLNIIAEILRFGDREFYKVRQRGRH